MRRVNAPKPHPNAAAKSRFVRLLTWSRSDPVFAMNAQAKRNGLGLRSSRPTNASTTGVSITAVVSSERSAVTAAPSRNTLR